MRIVLSDSPRNVATLPKGGNRDQVIHIRVSVGTALLADTQQELLDGGGIPITVADGVVSLVWTGNPVWMRSYSGSADLVLILVIP